jgi:hypothetical protein
MLLNAARRPDTQVDVVSLPAGRPRHLEYHAYESQVVGNIVRLTHGAAGKHDAVVIGCFYAERFGWYPSRVGGSEPPPREEVDGWGLFG